MKKNCKWKKPKGKEKKAYQKPTLYEYRQLKRLMGSSPGPGPG